MQPRSSSAGSRHATPPPRNIQELAEQRRSASARFRPLDVPVAAAPPAHQEPASRTSSRPSSPAPRMSSRGSSPSRDQYHDLVRRTYFGYETQYPNETDVQRRERTQQFRPPKLVEKPLDPKFTNYRGHSKCRYCSLLVPWQNLEAHQTDCALAPTRCPLVDSETGTPCALVCKGRELLQEHLQKCGSRTRRCENRGCGKLVSVQSTAHHLQHCSFERVRCPSCHGMLLRNEETTHGAVCPQTLVVCPLGCGESLRRGDLNAHMHNTLAAHKPLYAPDTKLRAPEDPQSVIAFLLNRLLDVYDKGRRSAQVSLQASRSTTPLPSPQTAFLRATAHHHHHPLDDHPSSILHGDEDSSILLDHRHHRSTHEDEGMLPPALRSAISAAATLRPVDVGNAHTAANTSSNSSTHHFPQQQHHDSPSATSLHAIVRAYRTRPKLEGPLQAIASPQLHLHVATELLWYREELGTLVTTLSPSQQGSSGEAAEMLGKGAQGKHRYDTLTSQDLQLLLTDITNGLEVLQLQVDTVSGRKDFSDTQANSSLNEDVAQLWRTVGLLWYEGKLALYERLYQE